MAKLKARGREEIFRVEKTMPGTSSGVAEVRHYRALTSDGSVLERMVIYYTPEEVARSYGRKSHGYGWKIRGRAKAGKSLEELLKIYLDGGWQLVEANPAYFRVSGDSIEALSQEPFISVEKAEKRSEKLASSRAKEKARREEKARVSDGPGFYVTNVYTGGLMRTRIADHERPFATYEEAEEFAWKRYRRFTTEFSFQYLLPVVVIAAESRQAAEANEGEVLWIDGKYKGPAVDPRQTSLF